MAKRRGATRKRRHRRIFIPVGKKKRAEIREYSRFVPSLEKLKGLTKITPAQQAQLTHAKKMLRHTENLKPVTELQAKALKKQELLVGKGIRAIRLRNTAPNAKFRLKKGGIFVTSNGRTWEYHPIKRNAEDVVTLLAERGEKLLERKDVVQITVWTARGRSDQGFSRVDRWVHYLQTRFLYESDGVQVSGAAADWVVGIAVEIKPKKVTKRNAK